MGVTFVTATCSKTMVVGVSIFLWPRLFFCNNFLMSDRLRLLIELVLTCCSFISLKKLAALYVAAI